MASMLRIGRGFENSWSHKNNNALTEKWLEKMVKAGKLPESALELVQARNADRVQTTHITSRRAAEIVPQYTKSRIPGELSPNLFDQDPAIEPPGQTASQ